MQKRWDLDKNVADFDAKKYLMSNKEKAGWIILNNKTPIGCGLFDYYNSDVSEKHHPWLLLLWIEPNHRGHKLGIQLTKKRMSYAKRHGYKIVYLDTTEAEKYHEKLGWKKIDEINYHGEKDIIMKFNLSKKFPQEKLKN